MSSPAWIFAPCAKACRPPKPKCKSHGVGLSERNPRVLKEIWSPIPFWIRTTANRNDEAHRTAGPARGGASQSGAKRRRDRQDDARSRRHSGAHRQIERARYIGRGADGPGARRIVE